MAGHPVRRAVERLRAPLVQDLGDRLRRLVHRFVRVRRLGAGNRHEPMKVRVRQPFDQATGPAAPTGLGPPLGAQDELAKPQRQTLLAYACRARNHHHLREPVRLDRLGQATACVGMPG